MGLSDYKINGFSKPVSALDDTPQLSAAELKEWFDSNSANELKNSINGIIDELKDVDVSRQHTHVNKDVLDALNEDITRFDVSKQHEHANKDVLDNITQVPIYDAPSDGKLYARKGGTWSEFDKDKYATKEELESLDSVVTLNYELAQNTYATKEELDSIESALDGILETQYDMMYVTFYVGLVMYTAPKGITWREFVNSSYNDGTFSASDYEDCVYVDGEYVYHGDYAVRLKDEIQQNASYILCSVEDGGER